MFFDRRAMRGQSHVIVVAFGLAEVMVAHTVEEDHENRDCHEEQDRSGRRVDEHANPEPGVAGRQPVDRRFEGVFTQMFHAQSPHKNNHAHQPREERRTDADRMAQRLAAVREQHDQKECQDRRERDQPEQCLSRHNFPTTSSCRFRPPRQYCGGDRRRSPGRDRQPLRLRRPQRR